MIDIKERWFNVYSNNSHGECYFSKSFTDTECYEFGERFNGKRLYRIHVRLK